MLKDFPKIECPFVRHEREDGAYLATPEINTSRRTGGSYEWVVNDPRTYAVEKLDGTNVSIEIRDGQVVAAWNRKNRIPGWSPDKGDQYLREGIMNALQRGYHEFLGDGQHFGELMGPKIQGNPYDLSERIWVPFESYAKDRLQYESWGNYGTQFEDIAQWFDMGLIPLFYSKWHGCSFDEAEEQDAYTEGVMFRHPEPEDIDTIPYAKVRHDMFA